MLSVRIHTRFLYLLLLACMAFVIMAGCSLLSVTGESMAVGMRPTLTPAYFTLPPGATPTPTPFQPVSDEIVYVELAVPVGTASPSPTSPVATPVNLEPQTPLAPVPKQVNILLLGSDQRQGQPGVRTDTIILATLNSEEGTVNLTSFPRDLYVNVPGWGMQRINTAYQLGGFDLLGSTLLYNFGVVVDHSIMINITSFRQVIDSLGGIDVQVGEELMDKYAGQWITIPVGEKHMDGQMAEWYVRSRKTTSDFARTRRQQEVLQAIFHKLINLNALKRAPEFYELYQENVEMDLSLTDMLPFLPLAATVSDSSRIHHYFIGPNEVYDYITPEGAMVLVPRYDAVSIVINQALNLP